MKLILIFIDFLLPSVIAAQEHFSHRPQPPMPKIDSIVFDKHLTDPFFFQTERPRTMHSGGTLTLTNTKTGKSDTSNTPNKEWQITVNCRLRDSARNHHGFDSCYSYLEGDTVIVVIKPFADLVDHSKIEERLIVHIIRNRFYVECTWTSTSSHRLLILSQKLILKNPVTEPGDKIMGELTVRCVNAGPNPPATLSKFEGPFTTTVQ